METSKTLSARLARLSPEKRKLLEKRLRRKPASPATEAATAAPTEELRTTGKEIPFETLPEQLLQPTASLLDADLWDSLLEVGHREARARWSADDLREEADGEPERNRVAVLSVSLALDEMGVFRRAGERYTSEELRQHCQVLPDYRRAIRRWLEMLADEGYLTREGDAFVCVRPVPTELPDLEVDEEQRGRFRTGLPAMLRGSKHPLEYLIPGGSSKRVEETYERSPTFRYCNGVSAALLRAQVEALPAGRKLRVLEVGAGTGGTTVSLLPELPAERSIYAYTDVSRYFTDLGRQKFSQYPFLSFAELDIESDPTRQGFPAESFDWIVAAHVLHATRDLRQTLAHVVRLLAPGGVLLLLEETRFLRKFNFTMGFLPGFDRFEDEELRQLHPLLDSEQWGELLLANGFEGFQTFTDPDALPQVLGVDVMLAHKPL